MNKIEIPSRTVGGRRVYTTPEGDFPSITTVLSAMKDRSGLD